VEHPYHIVGNRAIVKSLEEIADRIHDFSMVVRKLDFQDLHKYPEAVNKIL